MLSAEPQQQLIVKACKLCCIKSYKRQRPDGCKSTEQLWLAPQKVQAWQGRVFAFSKDTLSIQISLRASVITQHHCKHWYMQSVRAYLGCCTLQQTAEKVAESKAACCKAAAQAEGQWRGVLCLQSEFLVPGIVAYLSASAAAALVLLLGSERCGCCRLSCRRRTAMPRCCGTQQCCSGTRTLKKKPVLPGVLGTKANQPPYTQHTCAACWQWPRIPYRPPLPWCTCLHKQSACINININAFCWFRSSQS